MIEDNISCSLDVNKDNLKADQTLLHQIKNEKNWIQFDTISRQDDVSLPPFLYVSWLFFKPALLRNISWAYYLNSILNYGKKTRLSQNLLGGRRRCPANMLSHWKIHVKLFAKWIAIILLVYSLTASTSHPSRFALEVPKRPHIVSAVFPNDFIFVTLVSFFASKS